ncbi:hypothetical protein OQZ33_00325 [Pedobacter sp. MC2016-05]|uniref:hypothetical protein n=1 Tax=Pedobacter sp. MC2016-05 TaxID=2994474 RepID=UPI00224806EC|nr:hypothetical protein [Pedobacter sp. MC2016-05]MCX2472765.1 hypothetical protein [Pedobacter sp. MC2016-05]
MVTLDIYFMQGITIVVIIKLIVVGKVYNDFNKKISETAIAALKIPHFDGKGSTKNE